MTDDNGTAEAATTPVIVLEVFEGAPVTQTVVSIVNAGDGLSDAMAIAPQIVRRGNRLRVVLDVVCTEVHHKAARGYKPTDANAPLARKAVLSAETVSLLEVGQSAHVDQVLAEQREKVSLLHAERTGQPALEGTETGVPPLRPVPDDA